MGADHAVPVEEPSPTPAPEPSRPARAVRAAPRNALPAPLQEAYESVSGVALDGVEVRYSSPEPRQLGALAFTEGSRIHIGPGQDRHLAHEAWHVVQQRQGRVRATTSIAGRGVNVDHVLEAEADRMAALAPRIQRNLAAPGRQRDGRVHDAPTRIQRRTVTRPSRGRSPAVVQGVWAGLTPEDTQLIYSDPITHLRSWALERKDQLTTDAQRDGLELLGELAHAAPEAREIRDRVVSYLQGTLNHSGIFTVPYLVSQITAAASDPDPLGGPAEDHEEDRTDAPVTRVSFEQLNLIDFGVLTKDDEALQQIFVNMATDIGAPPTQATYEKWYSSGVLTRSGFRALFGDEQGEPMQMKRTPGSLSFQAAYTTANHGAFKNVTYKLDTPNGNVAFGTVHSKTTWKDPVVGGSKVALNAGSKNKRYGLMKSGLVEIAKASRGQHFSIANRIMKNGCGHASPPKLTWHHLSKEYDMVLVDRVVHQKHGHNGGVLVWK